MAQLARRDIWVVDVEVVELVRRSVNFKECKDGKGIVLKNKRYSFDGSADILEEEEVETTPLVVPNGMQPHEVMAMRQQNNMDDLYSNPNKPVPVKQQPVTVNTNRVMYKVYFDPAIQYINEVKRYKLTKDKEYNVYQVIAHPTGKLDLQKIVIMDDTSKILTIDEKYFTTAGRGLFADEQLNFSGGSNRINGNERKPRLAFENEMFEGAPDVNMAAVANSSYPVDTGVIPADLMAVPDIRR